MRTTAMIYAALFTVFAAGCTHETRSDVGKTFSYDCSGLGKGWSDCTDKADAQCGTHNYKTISQSGGAAEKGASGNTEMKRTLVVSCK